MDDLKECGKDFRFGACSRQIAARPFTIYLIFFYFFLRFTMSSLKNRSHVVEFIKELKSSVNKFELICRKIVDV